MVVAALINDHSAIAWWIVAAYFGGAAATFWASRIARKSDRRFWLGTTILLIFMGLNKQLDLQSDLTSTARSIVRHEGWYAARRLMQVAFLLALAAIAFAIVIALLRSLRHSSYSVKMAAIGIAVLFTFVVMRAASFHHLDQWVTVSLAGLRSGWWLEIAGIGTIAFAAIAYRMRWRINRAR